MHRREAGFSLVELMITLIVLAVVVAALLVVMIGSNRSKSQTEGLVESQQAARTAIEILARDIRSAGFGVDKDALPPQPAFAYVDSTELILYANLQPVAYRTSAQPSLSNPPLAPAPGGNPLPFFVESAGTAYPAGYALPASKWRTGAEMVRYTLDINDDGVLNSADQVGGLATEAERSANPNDFVLARFVYGDSAGVVPTAGNNGGTIEKVGLVRGPGPDVPPLFTVYLGSNPIPWDWSAGAVPADRLDEISRVVINLTAESRRPDDDGVYRRTTLTTEINSLRNVPEAGFTSYQVDGIVYNDLDKDDTRDVGETGIPNVVVRLGSAAIGSTNASGYYLLSVPPGMYVLKQDVPEGFDPVGPESLVVNFLTSPANLTHDFSDAEETGGWITAYCYFDEDGDAAHDPTEEWVDHVEVTVNSTTKISDGLGKARFFVPPGSYSVAAEAPDSFVVQSTNPVSVTIADGDTAAVWFALGLGGKATVSGLVYRDSDRDGVYDTGEPGIAGAWVGVSKNSGLDVLGSATTNSSGAYSIEVPNNMPDAVDPYQITVQVPSGYYPTSSTVINDVWLDDGEVMTGQNFGMHSFQVITLVADRVLSLASAELMEKDWTGSDNQYDTKSRKDVDLILGSEYVSNPNVSVWFSNYDNSPLFAATPTYQRNAQKSVLAIGVGTFDSGNTRPDVITGIEKHASGNFIVWLNQNSSGNFGYLPTTGTYYTTQDGGDVTAVHVGLMDANASNDVLVGTKGPSGTTGSIEVWLNNGSGLFIRNETVPTGWGMGTGSLGVVRGLALADLDNDGDQDLVVVTRTSTYGGSLHVFERIGNSPGSRYNHKRTESLAGEGMAVAVLDANGDGFQDIATGSQTNSSSGELQYWRNEGSLNFTMARTVSTPGIPLSLAVGDFGGLASRKDLALGWRTSDVSFSGGIAIYFMDAGTLPGFTVDPTGGAGLYMTPALNVNNFNYGANPAPAGAALSDLAAAQKTSATTGQVLVIVR